MKMVIVMRKDLNMRKGKMCAQAGHAVLGVMQLAAAVKEESAYTNWYKDNLQTKICVGVNSEEELIDIYNKALQKGIITYLVQDYGLTEFNNEKTYTCLALEPSENEDVDEITGGLSLL